MSGAPPLQSLDVVLTAGCNLACSYCFEDAKNPRARLAADALRASVDRLLDSAEPRPRLTFFGGEPLLRFEAIRDTVAYAERRAARRLQYSVQTNGTLLDDDRLDFFVAHDAEVHLSMDGVSAVQAERGAGTFELLDRRLDRWRRHHRFWFDERLGVTMTLLPWTIERLAESVAYFVDKGVRRISFNPLITDSSSWRLERIDELERQFSSIDALCRRVFATTGHVPVDVLRHDGIDRYDPHRPRGRTMCGVAGGQTLSVDADGRAYGCMTFAESFQTQRTPLMRDQLGSLTMDDVRSAGFEASRQRFRRKARGLPVLAGKQRKRSGYGACRDCRYLSDCAVCPTSIAMQPGNDDPDRVPDFICAYNLVALAHRERFPAVHGAGSLVRSDDELPAQMVELGAAASGDRAEV